MSAFEKWWVGQMETRAVSNAPLCEAAFNAGKAEGIKEGMRRAAALLRNVEWTDAAMATAGFDEQCEDIYSAAILKEADA